MTRALLEAGAAVNKVDKTHGKYPLHVAARNGHVEVTRALLEAGANIDQATTSH